MVRVVKAFPLAGLLVLWLAFAAVAEEIEITWWSIWNLNPFEQIIVDRFNEEYAGRIRVVTEPRGNPDQLITALAGGVPPHVVKVDRFRIGSFANAGYLRPIDDLVARDRHEVNPEDIFPAAMQEAIFEGREYGLPLSVDARVLWYNQTLFEESGLDSNAPPRTWEELNAASNRLDRFHPNGDIAQLGFVPHWGNWYGFGWIWAAGGELLDESNRNVAWNSDAGRQALGFVAERLAHYGGTGPLDSFSAQYQNGPLLGGALAMEINTPTRASNFAEHAPQYSWAAAPVPRPSGLEDTPVSWSGGFALSIPVGAEHTEEAWEFIKFAASTWAQMQAIPLGAVPLRSSSVREFGDAPNPYFDAFVRIMPYSRFRPVVPVSDELARIYRNQIDDMLRTGEYPVDYILSETARLAQILLDEAWAE